jgi:hypothetical protein
MGGMNREQRPPKKKKKKPSPSAEDDGDTVEKKKRYYRTCGGADFSRKGNKRRSVSPDPYGHLAKDVPFNQPVQAPPSLSAPTRTTKSSLPNSLSGARRDILESERLDVIAKYRQRMGRA